MSRGALVVLLALAATAGSAAAQVARTPTLPPVEPHFDLGVPGRQPFPSDRFTVPDPGQRTGLRVMLPQTNCAVERSIQVALAHDAREKQNDRTARQRHGRRQQAECDRQQRRSERAHGYGAGTPIVNHELPVAERQRIECRHCVGHVARVALKQNDVAGLEPERLERAEVPRALPGHAQHVHAIARS